MTNKQTAFFLFLTIFISISLFNHMKASNKKTIKRNYKIILRHYKKKCPQETKELDSNEKLDISIPINNFEQFNNEDIKLPSFEEAFSDQALKKNNKNYFDSHDNNSKQYSLEKIDDRTRPFPSLKIQLSIINKNTIENNPESSSTTSSLEDDLLEDDSFKYNYSEEDYF